MISSNMTSNLPQSDASHRPPCIAVWSGWHGCTHPGTLEHCSWGDATDRVQFMCVSCSRQEKALWMRLRGWRFFQPDPEAACAPLWRVPEAENNKLTHWLTLCVHLKRCQPCGPTGHTFRWLIGSTFSSQLSSDTFETDSLLVSFI